ncbi:MAG TPA: serine protease [Gammaproteobacteria bacterium]|nr:serine protease [Gammaproteobacteria bacterium]
MDESNESAVKEPIVTAAFEHLTGPARGTATWISGSTLDVCLQDDQRIRIVESATTADASVVARLHRFEQTFELEARENQPLWVNGNHTTSKKLAARDLIEFGDNGPLSRFLLYQGHHPVRKSLGEIIKDCVDYTRTSRKPAHQRIQNAFIALLRDLTVRTTMLFRASVILMLALLATVSYLQIRSNQQLQQQVNSDVLRLQDFADDLSRTRQESLRVSDLKDLRQELGHQLSSANERLGKLEQSSKINNQVIASTAPMVAFIQGAYGFLETKTQRMLRYAVNSQGRPILTPFGKPLLTLEGKGPIAQRQYSGTGFVISSRGALLTNRHVALPWSKNENSKTPDTQGMQPKLIKLIGYMPGIENSCPIKLLKASTTADLAVLLCSGLKNKLRYLRISENDPKPGDEVIVLGYPTGLKSMLVQAGDAFIERLQKTGKPDFWSIAAALAQAKLIHPLASRGIIGQVSDATLVYDAETTHGGSGGPVLNDKGRVIGVNTAIMPEYGGSNFGVPASYIRKLLSSPMVKKYVAD